MQYAYKLYVLSQISRYLKKRLYYYLLIFTIHFNKNIYTPSHLGNYLIILQQQNSYTGHADTDQADRV